MKESEVEDSVYDWLRKKHPNESVRKQKSGADLAIFKVMTPSGQWEVHHTIHVECKRTEASNAKLDRSVGQALRYYMENKRSPTFLAIQHDYQKMKELKEILEFYDPPIGLLAVHDDSRVETVRNSKGQPSTETIP